MCVLNILGLWLKSLENSCYHDSYFPDYLLTYFYLLFEGHFKIVDVVLELVFEGAVSKPHSE